MFGQLCKNEKFVTIAIEIVKVIPLASGRKLFD
jgi:hypothetical protein